MGICQLCRCVLVVMLGSTSLSACSTVAHPAGAQPAGHVVSTSTSRALENNAHLENGASPFEDLTEFALRANEEGVRRALTDIDRRADTIRSALDSGGRRAFDSLLSKLRTAQSSRRYPEIAIHAVEGYRLLVDGLDEDALVVPKAVALLDYCGFRLTVLASSATPDWSALQATADETSGFWRSIEARIENRGLKDAMRTVVGGIETAARAHDLRMIAFAAQVDLDLVDLLESYFEETKSALPRIH